jgi:hypothetical protein
MSEPGFECANCVCHRHHGANLARPYLRSHEANTAFVRLCQACTPAPTFNDGEPLRCSRMNACGWTPIRLRNSLHSRRYSPFFFPGLLDALPVHEHPTGAGRGGLRCPEGLPQVVWALHSGPHCLRLNSRDKLEAAANDLEIATAASMPSGRVLRRWDGGDTGAFMMLRTLVVTWIRTNALKELWEGITIADMISATTSRSLDIYLANIGKMGTWVDTAFLHGLACSCHLDIIIFQEGMDPTLVGSSFAGEAVEALVPIAIVNSFHFCAMKPAQCEMGDSFFAGTVLPQQQGGTAASSAKPRNSGGTVLSQGDDEEDKHDGYFSGEHAVPRGSAD